MQPTTPSALTLDDNDATYQIKSYQPGHLYINTLHFTTSLIITPDKLITDWRPQQLTELTAEDLALFSDLQPTVLLIGTGAKLIFPPLNCYGFLINQGIGVEIMTTSAACHTYNALSAEGRNVAAGLIIN